ncbi:MAG: TIGR00730 family Rossman fold protein [Muribaculaceae bacterium]|nr:TIGR00730 family Rossman fold protein [Muribaculaceae bacterium]
MKNNQQTKHVAVYCSAASGLPAEWIDAARQVGRVIGELDATLVYGGVDAGLMREVAEAVKATGAGKVVGVVPARRAAMACQLNDIRIDTDGLDDRKSAMQEMADVFVVLPGGYGTLDELTGAMAYLRFNGVSGKKILLYNPDGLYDSLLALFETMISRGVMNRASLDDLIVVENADQLTTRLRQLIS